MAQYIDKDALAAEMKRRIKSTNNDVKIGAIESLTISKTLNSLISFIDTLEVKEVVAEQKGMCNGMLNTIIGDTWHIKIPLDKAGLKHGNKVKIFITKEE